MKKALIFIVIAVLSIGLVACGGGETAPESINLAHPAYMFTEEGESYKLSDDVEIVGEGASQDVIYTSSDSSIVEISETGELKVIGSGVATVTVASKANENVNVSADVLIYNYMGTYTGKKYVEAMGTDIRVTIKLLDDGSYLYYRYPMNVNLDGGGLMEGMTGRGTYEAVGNKINFGGNYLPEFSSELQIGSEGMAEMTGEMPTGGANTEMNLMQTSTEDMSESGSYKGVGESEDLGSVSYELTLNEGEYTLIATVQDSTAETVSKGSYSFYENNIEFFAESGITFNASYDSGRGVVEGVAIPVTAESSIVTVSVTLEKQ